MNTLPKAIRHDRPIPSSRARFQDPWVPYPRGAEALLAMAQLIKRPSEGRPQNLAIIGDPNFGKSHLLDHFADCYPDIVDEEVPRVQVLFVEMPPKADGAALLRELMTNMGATFRSQTPPDELLRKFCVRAESLRVLMIIIDEFNNGAWGRRDAAMTVVHTLRAISNRLRRPIVIGGTRDVDTVLKNDGQLYERFRRFELPGWSDEQALADLLATFQKQIGFTFEKSESAVSMVQSLAGPKLGRIACLLREAKRIAAADNTSVLTETHLTAGAKFVAGSIF